MPTATLHITLPADLAETVRRQVERGSYASDSELIREALRLWQDREDERERRLAAIRERIDVAIADPVRLTPEEVRQQLVRLHEETIRTEDWHR